MDPVAWPNDPVHALDGLCYKRLFETYSRHFGAQNLAFVHLNGLLDAGKDPWEVLIKEVMMLSLGKRSGDNDEAAFSHGRKPRKSNVSPSSISFSVADYFYLWRWGNYTTPTAIDKSSSPILPAGISNTARYFLLPKLNCVLPFLGLLEEILPKQCLNLQNMCKLWELQEEDAFTLLGRERSHLLHFDKGHDNTERDISGIKSYWTLPG